VTVLAYFAKILAVGTVPTTYPGHTRMHSISCAGFAARVTRQTLRIGGRPLTTRTFAFSTEGLEVAWTSYTVVCKRSVAGLAARVTVRALVACGTDDTQVMASETGAFSIEGREAAWAS
jgi:hypothetical protein